MSNPANPAGTSEMLGRVIYAPKDLIQIITGSLATMHASTMRLQQQARDSLKIPAQGAGT
jgi:hypothetical protein